MKNILKYSYVALFATAALAFSACEDDVKYSRLTEVSGMQVYFDMNTQTDYDIDANATSFTIPVLRALASDAASVPVTISFKQDSKFSCPNPNVEFAAGAKTGSITINYDVNQFEFDEYEDFTITIGGEGYATEYGISALNVHAGFPLPWSSVGVGTFDEEFYFGTGAMKCEIFQYDLDQYLYRIKNPLIKALDAWGEAVSKEASEWLYFRILQPGDKILGQDITEEHVGLVYFYSDYTAPNDGSPISNLFNTGYHHPSYDEELCIVFPGRFVSLADPSNWSYNRVLGYKEDGTPGAVQLAGNYYMFGVGGFGGQDQNGDIIITFPGFVLADYSAEVVTVGRLIDTKENGQAIFNVTLGADVASAKVAMAAGKDARIAYLMILDGDETVQEISASGEVRFAYDEPGDYICLVVTYDDEGNEQEVASTLINIPDNAAPTEVFEAVYTGIYSHGVASYRQDGALPFGEAFEDPADLYVSSLDESKCMISPWINKGYEETESLGEGLVFYWGDDDVLTVPQSFTGVPTSYGEMWAWDLVTAEVADMPSYYDDETGLLVFNLAWSVEAGHFGYTKDTYQATGVASQGVKAKAPAKKFGKEDFKNRKIVVGVDGQALVNKAPAKKHIPLTFEWKKFAQFMK